jgi:hypothetical protein
MPTPAALSSFLTRTLPLDSKFALKITEIHNESRVEDVLYAFAKFAKYPLVVVANWKQSKRGRSLKERYAQYDHIYLVESNQFESKAVYGQLLKKAYVYIHGSTTSSNRYLLSEAVASRLPILAFDEEKNRTLTGHEALYFKTHTEVISHMESMNSRLARILSKQVSRQMGKTAGKILARQYDHLIQEKRASCSKNRVNLFSKSKVA